VARATPCHWRSGSGEVRFFVRTLACAANSILHRARMLAKLAPVIMIELEVYAAGVRDLNKILELDRQLEAVPGLPYKVDGNHDIVSLELDEPTVSLREIRNVFLKLGLEPRFIGAVSPELGAAIQGAAA
jgi:hypothetical protein